MSDAINVGRSTPSDQLQFAFNYTPVFFWLLAIFLIVMIPSANPEQTVLPGIAFGLGLMILAVVIGVGLEQDAKGQLEEERTGLRVVLLVAGALAVAYGGVYPVLRPVVVTNVVFVYSGAVASYLIHIGFAFRRYFSYLSMGNIAFVRGLLVNLLFLILLTVLLLIILR